jgi:hypothetical protein
VIRVIRSSKWGATNGCDMVFTLAVKKDLHHEGLEDTWRLTRGRDVWALVGLPLGLLGDALCFLFCLARRHGDHREAIAFGLRFWLCVGSPSCTLRVLLLSAGRPVVFSVPEASFFHRTLLGLG